MIPPENGQYYTIKELVEAKGTPLPVRSALLTMESRILALEHDLAESAEQHEAFKQEVSDAVVEYQYSAGPKFKATFERFIIAKPDPLVEVIAGWTGGTVLLASDLRAALEARGLEIREKGQ